MERRTVSLPFSCIQGLGFYLTLTSVGTREVLGETEIWLLRQSFDRSGRYASTNSGGPVGEILRVC